MVPYRFSCKGGFLNTQVYIPHVKLSHLCRGGSGAGSLGGAQQLTGGGVVAEMFRGLRKPSRFSGGGGSSRNFPWSPRNRPDSVGGGG